MSANARIRIGFIGFGEVGQTFARDLLTSGSVSITAWDRLVDSVAGARLEARAGELGVRIVGSDREVAARSDIILSAVTADQVEVVVTGLAPHLKPRHRVFDLNSAAPETKCRAARIVEAAGARYIEGAVMAPVLKPGIRVPILAGGPAAAVLADELNALGMNLTTVSVEHGRASAIKLCRSIMIKGLEALIVTCTAAAGRWDVTDTVLASLAETFPAIDWPSLAEDMGERVAIHGVRRAAEMREVADMLARLDLDPSLALAVAETQQKNAIARSDI